MKNKNSSDLYASLSVSSIESNSGDFEVLSLRISHRSSAVVQAFNTAFQRPALTLFTDGISQHLADRLLDSVKNESIIVEEASNGVQAGSAIDLLVSSEAIKYDDGMLHGIRRIFREAGK